MSPEPAARAYEANTLRAIHHPRADQTPPATSGDEPPTRLTPLLAIRASADGKNGPAYLPRSSTGSTEQGKQSPAPDIICFAMRAESPSRPQPPPPHTKPPESTYRTRADGTATNEHRDHRNPPKLSNATSRDPPQMRPMPAPLSHNHRMDHPAPRAMETLLLHRMRQPGPQPRRKGRHWARSEPDPAETAAEDRMSATPRPATAYVARALSGLTSCGHWHPTEAEAQECADEHNQQLREDAKRWGRPVDQQELRTIRYCSTECDSRDQQEDRSPEGKEDPGASPPRRRNQNTKPPRENRRTA